MKFTLYSQIAIGTVLGISSLTIWNDPAQAVYSVCKKTQLNCLRRGDSGDLVRNLVEDLRRAEYYNGKETEHFDVEVEKAVKAFQDDHRHLKNDDEKRFQDLTVDGIVGQESIYRLCQRAYRGCKADLNCYHGSVKWLIPCWEKYKSLIPRKHNI
jgi:Putative peptidoglycan binding domain